MLRLRSENQQLIAENDNLIGLLQSKLTKTGLKKGQDVANVFRNDAMVTPKAKTQSKGFKKRKEADQESVIYEMDLKEWKEDEPGGHGHKHYGKRGSKA